MKHPNSNPPQVFSLRIFLAALAILVGGTIIAVVLIVRAADHRQGPAAVSSPATVDTPLDAPNPPAPPGAEAGEPVTDDKDPSQQDAPPPAAVEPVSNRLKTGSTVVSAPPEPAPGEDGDGPEASPVGDDADSKPPPASRHSRRRSGPTGTGQWWLGPLTARARVFLIDRMDEDGLRRRYRPAPIGQRYVALSLTLRWEGPKTREIILDGSARGRPTVSLLADDKPYEPLGRLTAESPLPTPLSTERVAVTRGDPVSLELVFLVPEEIQSFTLRIERQSHGTIELPAATRTRPAELAGLWRKARGQVIPLRYDDPVIDALADPRCRRLRIAHNQMGLLQAILPFAAVTSSPILSGDNTAAIPITLSRGNHTQPAMLRLTEGGASLLLYVGEQPNATFLFERAPP